MMLVIVLALVGAAVLGIVAGLTYRGFLMIGDQRKLDVMTLQLMTENRMASATRSALSEIRRVSQDHLRNGRS